MDAAQKATSKAANFGAARAALEASGYAVTGDAESFTVTREGVELGAGRATWRGVDFPNGLAHKLGGSTLWGIVFRIRQIHAADRG